MGAAKEESPAPVKLTRLSPLRVRLSPVFASTLGTSLKAGSLRKEEASRRIGLLFGTVADRVVIVNHFRFVLHVEADKTDVAEGFPPSSPLGVLLVDAKSDPGLPASDLVGWFRYATRSGFLEDDVTFHNQHFRRASDIALLLRVEGKSASAEVYNKRSNSTLSRTDPSCGIFYFSPALQENAPLELSLVAPLAPELYLRAYEATDAFLDSTSRFSRLKELLASTAFTARTLGKRLGAIALAALVGLVLGMFLAVKFRPQIPIAAVQTRESRVPGPPPGAPEAQASVAPAAISPVANLAPAQQSLPAAVPHPGTQAPEPNLAKATPVLPPGISLARAERPAADPLLTPAPTVAPVASQPSRVTQPSPAPVTALPVQIISTLPAVPVSPSSTSLPTSSPAVTSPVPTPDVPVYTAPRPLRQIMPAISGSSFVIYKDLVVPVEVTVDSLGRVVAAHAIPGEEKIGQIVIGTALKAAEQWRFEPAPSSRAAVTRQVHHCLSLSSSRPVVVG